VFLDVIQVKKKFQKTDAFKCVFWAILKKCFLEEYLLYTLLFKHILEEKSPSN